MGNVRLLDAETINQIAAGEVIDRPSSIVKELVENAIDAHSTAITVEIRGGGIQLLRVTDNGFGIDREDVQPAFLRHATSKIKNADDLSHIVSLGFRGEALSSISAVSHVELLTKRQEDMLGTRYVVNGGIEEGISDVGCPNGTTFLVRDVFYNVPARRKFLKSAMTEAGYITELMYRLAVSHPEISFSFINQGRTALYTSGNGNLRDAIYSVYGREIAKNLLPVEKQCEGFSVSGYIGRPIAARGNRANENYFLNGRYIQSRVITKAIEEAYKSHIMQHKFPFTCLMLTFEPDKIDINVHPSKMEVRIEQQELVYEQLYKVISDTLRQAVLIPDVSIGEEEKKVTPSLPKPPEAYMTKSRQEYQQHVAKEILAEASPYLAGKQETLPLWSQRKQEPNAENGVTAEKVPVITQPYSKATESQTPANQISISSQAVPPKQHFTSASVAPETIDVNSASTTPAPAPSAHQAKEETLHPSEPTPMSEPIQLSSPAQMDESVQPSTPVQLDEPQQPSAPSVPDYRIIGQVFGTYWMLEVENQLYMIDQHAAHEKIIYERMVKAYKNKQVMSQQLCPPVIISLSLREEETYLRYKDRFEALGFELEPFGGHEYRMSAVPVDLYRLTEDELFTSLLDQLIESPVYGPADLILEKIASMSCKAAIKGNTRISELEARHLVEELMTLENPFQCPHGRPVIITMSKYEMEKKFKRII